jgi:hypothetical protein
MVQVTQAVTKPSPSQQRWMDLAAELTPAKSLARTGAANDRAVTTISVIGLLLTGLGAATAELLTEDGLAHGLAIGTVIAASLSVVCALTAQVLTITRRLNSYDLVQVKAWYRRQFVLRAWPTQAATVLVIVAAVLAGATAVAVLTADPDTTPAITVKEVSPAGDGTRPVEVTVHADFPGLAPGRVATVIVSSEGNVLARAAISAPPSGIARVGFTVSDHAPAQPVTVMTQSPGQTCHGRLTPVHSEPSLSCKAS